MKKVTDLTGKRFGRWCVTSMAPKRGKKIVWNCLCDCGQSKVILGESLRIGVSKSCGCYRDELAKEMGGQNFKGHEDISGGYFNRIKHEAGKRGLEFDLTIQFLWELYLQQDKRCKLSNVPIVFIRNYERDLKKGQTASLDRIDSSKGYIEGNVQWVHKDVNFMKYTLDQSRFLEYVKLIYENLCQNHPII